MVANKIDKLKPGQTITPPLAVNDANTIITLCAKEKTGLNQSAAGINKLKVVIQEKITKLFEQAKSPFLLNQRQHDLILELNIKLKKLEAENTDRIHYEVVSYHLKQMLEVVAQLTGKAINERMLDTVFRSFCIGK